MNPISLTDDQFWDLIPDSGGIYFIYGYNNKLPFKINRVLRVDKDGVLYIGKSENLRKRLRILLRTINPKLKSNAHTFGKKYNDNKKLRQAFPLHSLHVSYQVSKNAKILESKKLGDYIAKFGEVPPFNSSK